MREIHERKWNELSDIWQQLYENSITATPFQSYEFLTFTKKGKPYRKNLFRLIGVREWNLVLYNDGRVVAIAPLLIKRMRGRYSVALRGHYTAANQLDFIYDSWTYDDFKFLMDYIQNKLGSPSLMLDRVSEKTVTSGYLKQYLSSNQTNAEKCFSIPITKSYDDWRMSLHQSVRRNLSSFYNRLKRDDLQWSFDVYYHQSIGKTLCKRLMRVYADRFITKNSIRLSIFRKPVVWLLRMQLMRDKMTRWLNRPENNFHAVFSIGPDVAAFSSGVICRDKRIILHRLAISTKYHRYGPGGLLLSSIVSHIIAQNQSGDMDIIELDLSQGGQGGMSYKQNYGGKVHYCYVFHS